MSNPIAEAWHPKGALHAYNALRAANPHLPPPNLVTPDEIDVRLGGEGTVPSVTLRIYIALPDAWKADA